MDVRSNSPSDPMAVWWSALAMQPEGGGVHVYCAELMAAAARIAPEHDYAARVRADAASFVPASVAIDRAASGSGIRRVLAAARPPDRSVSIVHGLDAQLPRGTASAAKVVTIHDLSVFGPAVRHVRARVRRATTTRAIRSADRVIANSEATAAAIADRFDVSPVVTPLAPRTSVRRVGSAGVDAIRRRFGLPQRFVLHVGAVDGRKRIAETADACRRLGVQMVAAGPRLIGAPMPEGCHHLGYVNDDTLSALYTAASCVAYVSSYEGFGLPIAESLGCGTPVVATSTGAAPEIEAVAGASLRLLDADVGVEEVAAALGDQLDAPTPDALADDIHAAFNWDATAAKTLAVYRSLT